MWISVKNYEGLYEVSNLGRVRSFHRNGEKILRNNIRPDGRCSVQLYKDGSNSRLFVHRLVAEAFLPNLECKPEVNHKDLMSTNNRLDNLEWVTKQENQEHANLNEAQYRGQESHNTELTEKDVFEIYTRIDNRETLGSISKDYPIGYQGLYRIKRGMTWKHTYRIWKGGDIND